MPKLPKPTIHMIKLCVGVATLEELETYREERAHWWGADYGENVHVHRTRTMPKRFAEMEGAAPRSTGSSRASSAVASRFSASPKPSTSRASPAATSSCPPT